MPTDEHDKSWVKLFFRALTLAVAAGVAAGILIALIAKGNAGRALNCVTNSLATRNAPTTQDAKAHIAEAVARRAYDAAFAKVIFDLATKQTKARTTADFKAFVVQVPKLATASEAYVHTLEADQRIRAQTPLGKC